MEEKVSFGKFVARKRKEKGMTQRELAEKLYVTESAVSKWERGVSYPDITLLTTLCAELGVTEHELIAGSEDIQMRAAERQAARDRRLVKAWSWTFYLLYGLSLLCCLIVNLAVQRTLSWFFIVLTAEMAAFSLTSLPLLLERNRGVWTLCAFFGSLNALLLTCCLYTGGDWFGVTFVSLLFGFAVVFLPFVLRALPLPAPFGGHRTLLCFLVDTALLFALLAAACAYSGTPAGTAFRVAAFCLVYPWGVMACARYLPVNALFKAAGCCVLTGAFVFSVNGVINALVGNGPFMLPPWNLLRWCEPYLSGNINVVITLCCLAAALALLPGGVALAVRSRRGR